MRAGAKPTVAIATKARAAKPRAERQRLGYKDQRELDALPDRIAGLEAEIADLEAVLADPRLYERDRPRFEHTTDALETARAALAPLVDATLANVARLGPEASHTGPIRRGDAQTVALHLEGLSAQAPSRGRAG